MDFKSIASNITKVAFNAPALAPQAAPPSAPLAGGGATSATPAAPAADASNIKATGSRSTIGLMQTARDQIVGDFRAMFGDVVRSNARFESANQALGTALASGDPGAIQKATEGLKSAVVDLQKQLQRLPGEVAKMKTLPPGVKDVYVPHLEEIQKIAGGLASVGAGGAKTTAAVQSGGGGEAGPAAQPAENQAAQGDRKLQKREERFKKLDKNGDGVLDAGEIGARKKLLRRDADGDGKISRDEFMAGPGRPAGGVKTGGGTAAPANPAPAPASAAPAAAAGGQPPAEAALEDRFKGLLAGFEKMQQAALSGKVEDFTAGRDSVVVSVQGVEGSRAGAKVTAHVGDGLASVG